MASFLFEHHKILCLGLFDNPDSLRNCSNIYNYSCIYKEAHGLDKYKRKIAEHSGGMCCMQRWYGEWTKRIKDADTIMISDGIRGRDIIEYIHKQNPKARIIVYYLNSNFDHGRNEPSKYKDLPCELVTFDKKNADDYQIKFKHYYYPYMEKRIYTIDSQYTQDIFFVGEDKGRLSELLRWKKVFENQGLKCKFLILKTKHKFYFQHRNQLINEPIPYDKIIKEIRKSRAILDFTQSRQHGITYRPMEAMCFQKKLITNFEEITTYNFYNPNNVFRLSYDKIDGLKNFLEKTYEPIDDDIRKEYVAANWLNSFFRTSNINNITNSSLEQGL